MTYEIATRGLAARGNVITALSNPEQSANFTISWATAGNSLSILLSTYTNLLYISVQDLALEKTYLNLATDEAMDLFDQSKLTAPNITDVTGVVAAYNLTSGPTVIKDLIPAELQTKVLDSAVTGDGLFLGPIRLEKLTDEGLPFLVASFTVPVYNNTTASLDARQVMGYMTVVFNMENVRSITRNTQGLGETGQVLLLGPDRLGNRWGNGTGKFDINPEVDRYKYVLAPANRQDLATQTGLVGNYPIALEAWRNADAKGGQGGSELDSKNASGTRASVGYGLCQFPQQTALTFLDTALLRFLQPTRRFFF